MATPKSGKTAPIEIDEGQLESLASIHCTWQELADAFKCNKSTLQRNYAAVVKRGRKLGKVSARRILWQQSKKGNSIALRWLIHNILGERIDDHKDPVAVINNNVKPPESDDQLQARIMMLLSKRERTA